LQADLGSSVASRTRLSTLTSPEHPGTAKSLVNRSLRERLLFLRALIDQIFEKALPSLVSRSCGTRLIF
jgi:hypothetical protein